MMYPNLGGETYVLYDQACVNRSDSLLWTVYRKKARKPFKKKEV